ncbi:unknown protein [Seminavis robusta]|uniref:Uncharacterized protein n=1 Tax=Seminavis robusta TaxID=568900 RepID=A0A9N8ENE9_9STRA|nr:unknown protein [Seminavis robusta]|eukprot:Sro1621_g286550.1 n/a (136) ;mRNA; f:1717-2124
MNEFLNAFGGQEDQDQEDGRQMQEEDKHEEATMEAIRALTNLIEEKFSGRIPQGKSAAQPGSKVMKALFDHFKALVPGAKGRNEKGHKRAAKRKENKANKKKKWTEEQKKQAEKEKQAEKATAPVRPRLTRSLPR